MEEKQEYLKRKEIEISQSNEELKIKVKSLLEERKCVK
jgi:hypothetical protein